MSVISCLIDSRSMVSLGLSIHRSLNPRSRSNLRRNLRPNFASASLSAPSETIEMLKDCELDVEKFQREGIDSFDLVVAGAGPSGLTVGSRVAQSGFKVCIVDPSPLSLWPNNYGVWVDEFEAMGLDDCFHKVWSRADVFLENNDPPKQAFLRPFFLNSTRRLNRPYARVDRPKLKRKLIESCKENGVYFHEAFVNSVDKSSDLSSVICSKGNPLKARLVLDATGHSRRLIHYDQKFDPGFQGAYGYMAKVESHPFDEDAMLFMDWRDDYAANDPELFKRATDLPTFLYAMPFSKTLIFFEETSLVAKPIAPFDDLKERLEKRLQHLGIKILEKSEEEYCSIPMGGVLPQKPQNIIGIGGTAGMVHPATGYMISRMLGAAPGLADAIVDQLFLHEEWNKETSSEVCKTLWNQLWPVERIRQREFKRFGMEVLLQLDLKETRNFFSAFFTLSDHHWQGFLSSRLSLAELIGFGWHLFLQSSNDTRITILKKGAPHLFFLLSSVLPTYFK